ncbi:hypothetical protein AB6A40_007122 [Gnathostoma spinigerum]|uniref:PDZ domain-containing protein n=1 Tax=Gnathostoma spinigerum TaxID=75299 RepID=A0ABD6ETP5_9BILA
MREKIVLERETPDERLGLGIAIESDETDQKVLSVVVEQLDPGSIAAESGLRVGDRVWSVGGKNVHECSRAKCLALFQRSSMNVTLMISRHKNHSNSHSNRRTNRSGRVVGNTNGKTHKSREQYENPTEGMSYI